MKALFTTTFLIGLSLSLHPALASSHDPERPTPSVGMLEGGGIGARPLVRYLAATLQLSRAQTAAVQHAVQSHQLQTRSLQQLALCLEQVLTPAEYEQYLQLQDDAATYKSLRVLALR
ncbi:hypothetical protein [Hymenobacter sp. BRD67]|uniref:hypothetical protein n=1 Tax=Hymenobacter sp. BRD67 TaxID=2675877 RepID=UPI001564C178|nr:hypothetical protein [Hymenobacter sp. BRD67]QKG53070.1 hypothetical protein GKZ67_11245 [Hymenobacter sp. BRD67]